MICFNGVWEINNGFYECGFCNVKLQFTRPPTDVVASIKMVMVIHQFCPNLYLDYKFQRGFIAVSCNRCDYTAGISI